MLRSFIFLSTFLLLSCGSSGGDGVPPLAPAAEFSGTVTDAVIVNGILSVYAFDDGIKGELIAETMTDSDGDFIFDEFRSPSRPVIVEVSGGHYTEEASGVVVNLLEGQVLRAYMFYEEGTPITVQVTPLTHLASCLADNKIGNATNVNNAITEATSVFSGLAGIDILGTRPLDITDPANANFELTDGLRYGAFLAAISSYTAEVSVINGVTPHQFNQNTSIYATQVLCQDILTDGIFNGIGFINGTSSVGQLALGSVPLDSYTVRTTLAQNILSIVGSENNKTNLGVSFFVQYANGVASSTDAVFNGEPAVPVDQVPPVSTASLLPDSFIKGLIDLSFTVTDSIGVESVVFYVNGAFHSNGQVLTPLLSLNTSTYADGILTVSVVATDVLGNESSTDFTYLVDNTSPTIALTSPVLVPSASYVASGTYLAEGSPITSITANGVSATVDVGLGTWSADLTLLSGGNTVNLVITDSVGNTNNLDVIVDVDLIFPNITVVSTLATFTTFQGQLNLCTFGTLTNTSASTNPVCVSTDNVSLNGAALDSALASSGYRVVAFTPSDPTGAGVFSSFAELQVEYQYKVNDSLVVDWSVVPTPTLGGTIYYLPMATEYLGETWFQAVPTDLHTIIIRVTDGAGNVALLDWNIKTDVLVPELVVQQKVDDSIFLAADFASRASVDGATIPVTYEFDNSSSNAYLISLSDSNQHSVDHIYETGVRKNRSRVKAQELWEAVPCSAGVCSTSGTTQIVTDVTFTAKASQSGTVLPSPILYGAYQDVLSDFPSVGVIADVPVVTPFLTYECTPIYANANSSFPVTLAYANGSTVFPVCAATANGKVAPYVVTSSLQSTTIYTVENEPGYPLNDVFSTSVPSVVFTDEFVVVNATSGTSIFPINGWYRVPAGASIIISKNVLLPALAHFYDTELGDIVSFSSYAQKKYDKATTWSIDTDLTIVRVVDPGDIALADSLTPAISLVGSGIYEHTISR